MKHGCAVLVHPTQLTKRLRYFSEKDKHVQRCIETLLVEGLDPSAMFFEGLSRAIETEDEEEEEEEEVEDDDEEEIPATARQLERIDRILSTLEAQVMPRLEKFMRDALVNVERYGWTPLGHGDDSKKTPFVPDEFVMVRLQPSGDYVCRDLRGETMKVHFFRRLTAREEPTSDLSVLLADFESMEVLRASHSCATKNASRPLVVSAAAAADDASGMNQAATAAAAASSSSSSRRNAAGDDNNNRLLKDGRLQDLASLFSTETRSASASEGGETLSGELADSVLVQRNVQGLYNLLMQEKVANRKRRERDRRAATTMMLKKRPRVVTDDDQDEEEEEEDAAGPLRYQLPEGVHHVASSLGVRPNAFANEVRKNQWQLEVEQVMLGRESDADSTANATETRQGIGRHLGAAVEGSKHQTKHKCRLLQKFFVSEVLKDWLETIKIPMAVVEDSNLARFYLYGAILKPQSFASWLTRNTGFRATDLDLKKALTASAAASASASVSAS